MSEIKIELRGFGTNADTSDNVIGELDITSSEDFPLSLTFQNFDIRNFSQRSGSFSKTFDVPATNNNNRVFNNLWKTGYIISSKNVAGNIPAVIYADNIPIVSGKFRITSITKDKNVKSYSCSFVGDNMDWASSIKNKELKDLRFSKDSYTTYASQDSSVSTLENEGIASVPYVFNNVQGVGGINQNLDHTDYEHNKDNLLYPLLSIGEGVSNKQQATTMDFVPCVYIKNVWDKIFQSEGYTVVSEFCDSDYFKSLCMPLYFQKQGEIADYKYGKILATADETMANYYYSPTNSSGASTRYTVYGDSVGNVTVDRRFGRVSGTTTPARFLFAGTDITDDSQDPNSPVTEYGNVQTGASARANGTTVVKYGNSAHTVTANIKIRHERDVSQNNGDWGSQPFEYTIGYELWEIGDDSSGIPDDDDNTTLYNAIANNYSSGNWTRRAADSVSFSKSPGNWSDIHTDTLTYTPTALTAGTQKFVVCMWVRVDDYPSGLGGSVEFFIAEGMSLEVSGSPEYYLGEDIDQIHWLMPKGKQSDFVIGLAQMFNLQFHTDPIAKKVYIEPYDYFYEEKSKCVDWTEKIDYSKDIQEEFIDKIKSTIIFKYKDASNDALLERYNKKNITDWGAYKEINTSGIFQDGEYVVENKFFSPTFNFREAEYVDNTGSNALGFGSTPTIPLYHTKYTELDQSHNIDRPEKSWDLGARILCTVPYLDGSQVRKYKTHRDGGNSAYSFAPNDNLDADSDYHAYFCRANFIHFDSLNYIGTATNGNYKASIGTYDGTEYFVDPNLSFNNVKHQLQTISHTKKGLVHYFHNTMLEQLKNKPRIKIVYVNLDYTDILRLDFRKLVYMDGIYYRINKISDFKPHKNESTKIELTEFWDLGSSDISGDVMDVYTNGLNM